MIFRCNFPHISLPPWGQWHFRTASWSSELLTAAHYGDLAKVETALRNFGDPDSQAACWWWYASPPARGVIFFDLLSGKKWIYNDIEWYIYIHMYICIYIYIEYISVPVNGPNKSMDIFKMQDERGGTALCMAASAGRLPLVPRWKRRRMSSRNMGGFMVI